MARRIAARDLLRRDRATLRDALSDEIELADLRRSAQAAGVDPDVVEDGYIAMRDGRVSLEGCYIDSRSTQTDTEGPR